MNYTGLKEEGEIGSISRSASTFLDKKNKIQNAQYFTPIAIARQMTEMLPMGDIESIGDYGAGSGILSGMTAIRQVHKHSTPCKKIHAFEVDKNLHKEINKTVETVIRYYKTKGHLPPELDIQGDFLEGINRIISNNEDSALVDAIVLNPPYKKIRKESKTGAQLMQAGIKVPNLYALFIMISMTWLKPGGAIIAITPRSFTNGSYFKDFRQWLKKNTSIDWIVRFNQRSNLFRNDNVLQENVIIRIKKGGQQTEKVRITACDDAESHPTMDVFMPSDIIFDNDIIRIPANKKDLLAIKKNKEYKYSLGDLGLGVSTGKIEEFRYREWMKENKEDALVPVLYAGHWVRGEKRVKGLGQCIGKKKAYIMNNKKTNKKLIESGTYIVIKRISANDDKKGRVHAAIIDGNEIKSTHLAIENHVQYFHCGGAGIDKPLAKGLLEFLSSNEVELLMKSISGTTQLNVGDLKQIRYPSKEDLIRIGIAA